MKRLYSALLFILAIAITASAQQGVPRKKFSPEQFDAELQKFITEQAGLTTQESAQFFPVYWEMQKKQRVLYAAQRKSCRVKPADEQGCRRAIEERDHADAELKRLQEQYHNKFFEILPASKVFDVIMAEDKFHRTKLKQWGRTPRPDGRKK